MPIQWDTPPAPMTAPAVAAPSGPSIQWDKSPQSEPMPISDSLAPNTVSFDLTGKTHGEQPPISTAIVPEMPPKEGLWGSVLTTLWPKGYNQGLFGWGNAITQAQQATEMERRALLRGDTKGALEAAKYNPLLWSFQPQPILETPGSVLGAVSKPTLPVPKMEAAAIPAQAPAPKEAMTLTPEMRAAEAQAYHGTPHTFDQFDTSKIGTGEGAQAYGHGLYFAENPEVAGSYAKSTQMANIRNNFLDALPEDADAAEVMGEIGSGRFTPAQEKVLKALNANDWLGFDHPAQAISQAYRSLKNYDPSPELVNAIGAWKSSGNLYKVDLLPQADEYLQWDKPLSEQSPKVQAAIEKLRASGRLKFLTPAPGFDPTGSEIYNAVERGFQKDRASVTTVAKAGGYATYGQPAASDAFSKAGIPGIKYLDQGSRAEGQGTSNYVIFNPEDVRITHRNGEPLTPQEKIDALNLTPDMQVPPAPPEGVRTPGEGAPVPATTGVQPPGEPPKPPAVTGGQPPPEPPPELMAQRVAPAVHKAVVDAATELMDTGGVARHPAMRLSDQIADLLASNRLQPTAVASILDKHGVSFEDFSAIWRQDVAQTARDLGRLGLASQKLKSIYEALPKTEQQALDAALSTEGLDLGTASQSLWKRLDNLRRASLVVQPATAMRNLETQVGRVGIDMLEKGIDEALQVATGRKSITEIHPAETFANQLRLFQSMNKGIRQAYRTLKGKITSEPTEAVMTNQRLTDEILSYYPMEQDKLFSRYMSDLTTTRTGVKGAVSGALDKAQRGIDFMNGLNRFQEYVVRRAVFLGELDRAIADAGMEPLSTLEATGRLHTIPLDAIQNAVGKSLEMTFAKSYSPTTLPGSFINFINRLPGGTLPIPFPRFLMNSVEFLLDYNPTGFLKLLSPTERAALAAGDYSTISKAITGSALLMTAYEIRSDPNLAGERWYEIRAGQRTIDTRPFNPFASYLFIADLAYRANHGTLQNVTWKDVLSGVLSANVRAGVGLYVVDQLLNGLNGLTDEEKIKRFLKGMTGNTLSGPLVFMQPIRDLFAQFDDKQRVLKDTADSPFWGPFLRKIPYGTVNFPDVESPTREGPIIQQSPLLRQMTGISFNQPKNALEKELDRLGFSRHDYAPGTGDPEADRLVNKYLGIVAEKTVMPLVETPAWKGLGDRTKAFMLAKEMQDAHKDAVKMARAEDPVRFMKLDLQRMPAKERLMLRENMGIDPAHLLDQMNR